MKSFELHLLYNSIMHSLKKFKKTSIQISKYKKITEYTNVRRTPRQQDSNKIKSTTLICKKGKL